MSSPELFEVHPDVKDSLRGHFEAHTAEAGQGKPLDKCMLGYAISVSDLLRPDVYSTVSAEGVKHCLEIVRPVTSEDEKAIQDAVNLIWDYVNGETTRLGLDQ